MKTFNRYLEESVMGKYNKGDVAEAILGAAVAAKFAVRPTTDISVEDVELMLSKIVNPVDVKPETASK